MSISVIEAAGPNDVTDFRFRGLRKVLVGGVKSNFYIDQRYIYLRSYFLPLATLIIIQNSLKGEHLLLL